MYIDPTTQPQVAAIPAAPKPRRILRVNFTAQQLISQHVNRIIDAAICSGEDAAYEYEEAELRYAMEKEYGNELIMHMAML